MNSYLEQSQALTERQENYYKPNPTFKTLVYRTNLYNPKILRKKSKKEYMISYWRERKFAPLDT